MSIIKDGKEYGVETRISDDNVYSTFKLTRNPQAPYQYTTISNPALGGMIYFKWDDLYYSYDNKNWVKIIKDSYIHFNNNDNIYLKVKRIFNNYHSVYDNSNKFISSSGHNIECILHPKLYSDFGFIFQGVGTSSTAQAFNITITIDGDITESCCENMLYKSYFHDVIINIPNNSIIPNHTFYEFCKGCHDGNSVTINGVISKVNGYAFQNAFQNSKIKTVNIQFSDDATVSVSSFNSTFYGNTMLTQGIDLPFKTVSSSSAFNATYRGCTALKKSGVIGFTGNISSYVANMFYGCTALEEMVWTATTPPTIPSTIWTNCPTTMKIYVPDSAVSAYKAASVWSSRAAYILPMSQRPE